ncbi:hypothetical protein C8R48DRAFT_764529 [Suillus tomentosus]|nr:hypothetical protein C8R48DRAFT_764529 [Suillus tomentosus]
MTGASRSTFNNFLSALVHPHCEPGAGKCWPSVLPVRLTNLPSFSDILSFYKEETQGNNTNYLSLMATSRSITKQEDLHETKSSRKLCESITIPSNISDLIPRPVTPTFASVPVEVKTARIPM